MTFLLFPEFFFSQDNVTSFIRFTNCGLSLLSCLKDSVSHIPIAFLLAEKTHTDIDQQVGYKIQI